MVAVRGRFEDGVARPEEPVEGHDGQQVIITFLEDRALSSTEGELTLSDIVQRWETDTGIPDLAHQHDHYLHGTPKREE